jgi:hypothetical protein
MSLVKNLQTSLQENLPGNAEQVWQNCARAREMEAAGDYEAACSAVGERWRGIGVQPALEGLDDLSRAEMSGCRSVLSSRLSKCADHMPQHTRQAKDMISEVNQSFSLSERHRWPPCGQMELVLLLDGRKALLTRHGYSSTFTLSLGDRAFRWQISR